MTFLTKLIKHVKIELAVEKKIIVFSIGKSGKTGIIGRRDREKGRREKIE